MGQAQGLGQKTIQMIADALPPVAHAGALVRQRVLEERLAGEVLEIGIMHPTVPDLLVRKPVGVFQHKHAEHEAYRFRRAPLIGKTIRQLIVEPGPVDLVRQDDKRMPHIDNLIETGAEKIVVPRLWCLFRSHGHPPNYAPSGKHGLPKKGIQNRKEMNSKHRFPAITKQPKPK